MRLQAAPKLTILERLSHIAVVAAVPLFFVQQYLENKQKKIEESLGYVESFQSDYIVSSRMAILRPWLEYSPEIEEIEKAGGISDQDLINLVESIRSTKDADSNYGFSTSIIILTEFFDRVATCIEARLCDGKTVDKALSMYASSFNCLYGPSIINLRRDLNLTAFGDGLRILTEKTQCPKA